MGVNTTRKRAILGDLPLRPTIAAAVILGLALPASLVAWHEVNDRRQTLFDSLASDHLRIVETLANGMQTPIWDVRPDTARPLIDVIMGDGRVTAVSVTAPVLPEPLTASKPEAEGDDTVALERDVVRDGRQIGRVRVEMTTAPLKAEAAHQGWQALLTTMFQMAFGLLLIFPLVRFKVLAPLGQLVDQSRQLAAGKLDQPFDWSRGDELGALGRSFEDTRRSLQALFRDLEQRNTELRLREQALSESEELYRLLVDLSPHGILLHDEDAILFVNPAGCRTLGASAPEAIVGRHYRELVADDQREPGEERLRRILQGESIGQAERRLITLDGREIVIAISGVPFTRADQRLALVIFVDITEMKQAQEEIARQRETLHQVEKISALGSLLAGVAHELNNPLSVVVGRATLLAEADLDPQVADGVAKIRAAADRCARIVKTFLAMARQQAPARVPVRIDRLIESALDLLAYGLDSAGIRVIQQLPPDLPETMADPDQLAQVFTNLITNAKQAMIGWHGPRELRIVATWDRSVNVIRASIRDSGPGIPKRVRGRIFDPFFTTKPEGAGTGIGLAVCRGIVEAHGGTIAVDEVEGGASFVVTIPVAGTAFPAARADSAEKPPVVDRMRILIVDDEPDIRKMLGEILSVDGHLVEEVANGREALARLEEGRFDLVISDLIMPVLDGPGLYEELRRREPKTAEHLLFITGDTLSPTVRQFLDRVGRPVIEKPFIPADVRSAVRAAVGHGDPQSREAGTRPVT
jgi:PAS domain S-box-containing protein